MKTRVARKVLKRARQGCRYRLSTFRQARRWERRHGDPWGISRLNLVAESWRSFAEAMVWMHKQIAMVWRMLNLPAHLVTGLKSVSQVRAESQFPEDVAPVSKTDAGRKIK